MIQYQKTNLRTKFEPPVMSFKNDVIFSKTPVIFRKKNK